MPTIPRLRNTSVARRPESPLAAVPAAQGAAVALGAAANVAGQLAEIAERERNRADEIRVNAAEVEGREAFNRALLDPKEGILQQRGVNAIEAQDAYEDRVTGALAEIESSLTTERQRALFRRQAERLKGDAAARVAAHVGGEMRAVDEASHKALISQDLEGIRAQAANDVAVQGTIASMAERIRTYADRNGIPDAVARETVSIATSVARLAQVTTLVDSGAVDRAMSVLDTHGTQLTTDDRQQAQELTAKARTERAAQEAVRSILAKGVTDEVALEQSLASIQDPAVRKQARAIVDTEQERFKAAEKTRSDRLFEQSAQTMRQAGAFATVEETIPLSDRMKMTNDQLTALGRVNSAPTDNHAKKWMEFYGMTPEERGKMTAADFQTKYWQHFDATHRTRAETLFEQSKSDPSGSGASGIMTDNERVFGTLTSMHLVSSPQRTDWRDGDFEFATAFEQEADRRIRAFEATGGKKASATDKDQLITQLGWEMTPLGVRGGKVFGFLPEKNRDEVSRDDILSAEGRSAGFPQRTYVPFENIPVFERDRISRAMRLNGRTATTRDIEDAYGAWVLGFRGRYERLTSRQAPE